MSRSLALVSLVFVTGCALDPVPLEGRTCRTYIDCLTGLGYTCSFTDGGEGFDTGPNGICILYDGGPRVDASSRSRDTGTNDADAMMDGATDADIDGAADTDVADADVDADAIDADVDADLDASTIDADLDADVDGNVNDADVDSATIDADVDAAN